MRARSSSSSFVNLSGSRTLRRLGALAFVAIAAVVLRGERATACGWSGPTVEDLSTFDPQILGEGLEGLHYDPYTAGFGEACTGCLLGALHESWLSYLGDKITSDDWEAVLFTASPADLAALGEVLAGRRKTPPAAYAKSSLLAPGAPRAKLVAALPVVALARRIERLAGAGGEPELSARERAERSKGLLAEAAAGAKVARDPFLRQRYTFLQIKSAFYTGQWDEVIELFDGAGAALAGPAPDLAWRARYYAAGALARVGQRARANLELARIHAGFPALAGPAANDFRPVEERDWRESLRLAKSARERVELWRLVGLTRDGQVAMSEILKLEPSSPLLPLLLVREVERAESRTADAWGIGVEPGAEKRQQREFAALEALAEAMVPHAKGHAWLPELVAGHLAAKRGDLATAKRRLGEVLRAQPKAPRVKNQVQASLALALVLDAAARGKPRGLEARSDEVARAMLELAPSFGRFGRVRGEVRTRLAAAYAASGKLVESELLQPGFVEGSAATAGKWREPAFLQALIDRAGKQTSPWDRFLLADSYTPAQLEQELALYHLTSGQLGEAAKRFATGRAASSKLGTDPFVIHLRDCHDCDHERYAEAPWTHASLAARMAQLEKVAKGTGEAASDASLALGNAFYNLTWYGNARVVLAESHQKLRTPKLAERWYKRAYEQSRKRERRAEAAFLAAKAELGGLITAAEKAAQADPGALAIDALPVPATWFTVLETYADTEYYKEVLAECSHFRAWTSRAR